MNMKRAFLTATDSFGDIQSGIVYYDGDSPRPVFDENLHIHQGQNGLWYLTIENLQWESRDLAELESHLRDWAKDEYPGFPAPCPHADIMAEVLARAFAAQLLADIGPDNLATVNERNAANDNPLICHSHDFCDSNMSMDSAWRALGFAPMAFAENGGPSDSEISLWNRAWDIAKANRFFLEGESGK